ncbi:MAG: HAMP domain-containing histidine kinase, partial [Cytophagaceae bacterium]|nr:HAMP domain-containing histidine kinase [Cytophagaceae bacterium]
MQDGNLVRVWGTQRDITEKKTMEVEREKTNQELRKINIDLDNFIYSASHDLKAPVSNIEGLIETLLDILKEKKYIDEETEAILQMINTSIRRFQETIKDLSEIGKAQKNMMDDVSDINVPDVVQEVLFSVEKLIAESDAVFNIDVFQCPQIKFSKANFRSIVLNLLTNAIKYRSPQRKLFVNISCHKKDQYYFYFNTFNVLIINNSIIFLCYQNKT